MLTLERKRGSKQTLQLQKLEKEELIKPKVSRKRETINSRIRETENDRSKLLLFTNVVIKIIRIKTINIHARK